MGFMVHEQNGNWSVANMPPQMQIVGAVPISYELYLQLKDKPHEAANHFQRKNGKIVSVQPKEIK